MKKYVVIVLGKNFLINRDDKIQKLGFFTTRYISVENQSQALNTALDLIREELKDVVLNEFSNPPIMFQDDLYEVDSFGDANAPGGGFTFFPDEDE